LNDFIILKVRHEHQSSRQWLVFARSSRMPDSWD